MSFFVLKNTVGKGIGVFATRKIEKGEHLFHVDLRNLPTYSLEELKHHPDGDHADYVGHGKYVINHSPASFLNHSCEPNCCCKMKSIAVKDIYAARDIEPGEELTIDYAATAVDQFAGQGFWVLDCKCGSANCRGKVSGDFFELPEELQRRYYPNLPPSIKRKYRARFRALFGRMRR